MPVLPSALYHVSTYLQTELQSIQNRKRTTGQWIHSNDSCWIDGCTSKDTAIAMGIKTSFDRFIGVRRFDLDDNDISMHVLDCFDLDVFCKTILYLYTITPLVQHDWERNPDIPVHKTDAFRTRKSISQGIFSCEALMLGPWLHRQSVTIRNL